MNPPADKTAASSVGERLKAARDRQGLTLQKIGEDLHLDLPVLEAMEENRFRALGAPVYARGHLRKYAQLLGLDVEAILAEYEATHSGPVAPDLKPKPVEHPTMVPERDRVRKPMATTVIVAAVLIVGAGAGFWWWRTHAAPEQSQPVPSAVTPEVVRESPAEPIATPVVPPASEAPEKAVEAKVAKRQRPEPSARKPARETPTVTAAATAPAVPGDGSISYLRLRFSGDSWVEIYDANGTRLLFDQRIAATARTVSGVPPFRVLLGNYAAVELTLNGRPVAIPERSRYGATARFRVLPGGSTLASWGS